jgi:hypothetical protein
MPLKTITNFPPGGFTYTQPETKMEFRQYLPLRDQAAAVADHRKANALPRATLSEAMQDIENWTCQRLNNDPEWCIAPAQKKTSPLLRFGKRLVEAVAVAAESVEKAAVGARIIYEWWGEGGRPVDPALAQSRADICLGCPKNSTEKTWLSGLSENAREQLQLRSNLKMTVNREEELGVCTVCECPLKLKVHTPLEHLAPNTPEGVLADLDKVDGPCWLRDEIRAKSPSST